MREPLIQRPINAINFSSARIGELERSSLNDCWEPGIKRGLNPAGVYELARMTYKPPLRTVEPGAVVAP